MRPRDQRAVTDSSIAVGFSQRLSGKLRTGFSPMFRLKPKNKISIPLPKGNGNLQSASQTFAVSRAPRLTAKRFDRGLKRPPDHTVLIPGGSLPQQHGGRPRNRAGSRKREPARRSSDRRKRPARLPAIR